MIYSLKVQSLEHSSLFVGLTRPPLLFGVSYNFAILNMMLCMIFYVFYSDFRYLAAMFPIHCIGYYICLKEPLFIELLNVRSQKCPFTFNKIFHGGNSYDPFQ